MNLLKVDTRIADELDEGSIVRCESGSFSQWGRVTMAYHDSIEILWEGGISESYRRAYLHRNPIFVPADGKHA